VPTINLLLNSLNALVDSLTGLERILTTPIPFSFSVHLWTVTLLYCAALPFQLVKTMGWITIPGTAAAAFIFTGFVVAGEEIENPVSTPNSSLIPDTDWFLSSLALTGMI
jgi:putative membrane protein